MISNIKVYKNEVQSILNKYFNSEKVKSNHEIGITTRYCCNVNGTTLIELDSVNVYFHVNDLKNIIKVKQIKKGLLYYFNIDDYIDGSNVNFYRGTYYLYYKGDRTILADYMFDNGHSIMVYRIADLLNRYNCDKGVFVKYCLRNETASSDHSGFESIFNDLYKKDRDELQKNFRNAIDNAKFYYDKDRDTEYKRLFKFFECNDGKTCPAMLVDFDNFKVYFPSIYTRGNSGRSEFDIDSINYLDSAVISPLVYLSGCIKHEKISNDYYLGS